jgi:Family of unknown function (DUF6049)
VKPARAFGGAAAVLAVAMLVVSAGVPAAAAPTRSTQAADTLQMFIDSVSPSTPTPTSTPKLLTVKIRLENTSDAPLKQVRLVGEREEPIEDQTTLDQALRGTLATSSPIEIPAIHPTTVDVPALSVVDATFTMRYSRADDDSGLCLCHKAVYPLYFSAHVLGGDGVDQRLGVVATFIPIFSDAPAPDRVSWIWPLLERPHRLLQDNVFTDDQLAGTVISGGRLDRALTVVEQVGPTIPLTLLIDPELIDELAVMAGPGGYTVQPAGGKKVPGTGQAAASEWLDRLRRVLQTDTKLQVEFTPYADPDFESLHKAGLTWTDTMPPAMGARIAAALPGQNLDATVAWPASGALSAATLATLAARGTSTVVLNSGAVTPRTPAGAVPPGLARLDSDGTDLAAALVSPAIESYAARAMVPNGLAELPQLVAELAVRAAQEPDAEHAVVITAPRYVNPSVGPAVQAIKDTSNSTFSKPVSLRDAVSGRLLPTGRSRLARVPASAPSLPDVVVDAASRLRHTLPDITALLTPPSPRKGVAGTPGPTAQALLAHLPVAQQRAESSAWAQRDAASSAEAAANARALNDQIDSIENGVQIVRPSSGSYTLGSESSKLPITVDNKLPYPVTIRISITTDVNGLPGFSAKDVGVQAVDSNQKRTLTVPTKTTRVGRIKVHAALLTPNGVTLGDSVPLTLRSTFLGKIGVVITIVAGVVLVLALLIRAGRRLRRRRRPAPPPDAAIERLGEVVR